MAKSVKAPDFDSGTVGSSPAIPARPDPLAQSVEHLPFKQGVRGSIPRRVTICRFSCEVLLGLLFLYLIQGEIVIRETEE